MAHKSPLAAVKETFGDKAKLVEALEKLTGEELWVARTNKSKGLGHVSNAKLLRLHATFTAVKEKFGTREKLVDAILELDKRSKDAGMRQRLLTWPVPRLFDVYKSTAKRNAASAAAKAPPSPKAPAAKAPAAKTPAAKAAPAAKKDAKPKAEKPAKPAKKSKGG